MYRIAYIKDSNIAVIARFLKQNAVDCNLNKEGNMLQNKDINIVDQINSQNQLIKSNDINLFEDGGRVCDYELCVYECNTDGEISRGDIDESTYNIDVLNYTNIDICIDLIKFIYYERNIFTLNDIKNRIELLDSAIMDNEIYFALNKMLTEKIKVIHNANNQDYHGYLTYINGYYIFNADNISDNSSYQHKVILPPVRKNKVVIKKKLKK